MYVYVPPEDFSQQKNLKMMVFGSDVFFLFPQQVIFSGSSRYTPEI